MVVSDKNLFVQTIIALIAKPEMLNKWSYVYMLFLECN